MRHRVLLASLAAVVVAAASVLSASAQTGIAGMRLGPQPQAWTVEIRPESVFAFKEMEAKFPSFEMRFRGGALVPIESPRGVTGAVILAPGRFSYVRRNKVTRVEGRCHAAVLRFNPSEYEKILPIVPRSVADIDHGAAEMAGALLLETFPRCFARDGQALIPPEGTLAATFFTPEHGDLLVLDNGESSAAYSFTKREYLFGASLERLQRPKTRR